MITPTLSQPRFHKRCQQLLDAGIDVHVFAFERKYYNVNSFSGVTRLTKLGGIEDGKYLKRIFSLLKAFFKVFSSVRECKKDYKIVLYAFSFDCFLIGKFAGIEKTIIEIGDLRVSKVSDFLWKYISKVADKIVLTSKGFLEHLSNRKSALVSKSHFIENKLDKAMFQENREDFLSNNDSSVITIGVIGFLRYEKPLVSIIRLAEKHPDRYIIKCFGDGPYKDLFEKSTLENVSYFGPYKGAKDLPDIYKQIDLNYVVYDSHSKNVRLALPNKLYESIYFLKPIVCSSNTFLEKEVLRYGVGKSVSSSNYEEFEKEMFAITVDDMNEWSKNCLKVLDKELLDDGKSEVQLILKSVLT